MTPMEAESVANAFHQAALASRVPREGESAEDYTARTKVVDLALVVNLIRGSDLMHGHGSAAGLLQVAQQLDGSTV